MPTKPGSWTDKRKAATPNARQESFGDRIADRVRGSADSRGYDSTWRKTRLRYLRRFPLCVGYKRQCGDAATLVDHKVARNLGGPDIESNYQSLCITCHARKTADERMIYRKLRGKR